MQKYIEIVAVLAGGWWLGLITAGRHARAMGFLVDVGLFLAFVGLAGFVGAVLLDSSLSEAVEGWLARWRKVKMGLRPRARVLAAQLSGVEPRGLAGE